MNRNNFQNMTNFKTSIIEMEKEKYKKYDNKKTKFCKKIKEGKECSYGENCNFAHSIEEFRVLPCNFWKTCFKVVKGKDNKFYNTGKFICRFIHCEEDKENYMKRNNIEFKIKDENMNNIIAKMSDISIGDKYDSESEDESDDDIELILDNPKILKQIWEKNKYYKTKFCKSYNNNEECQYKENCDFAHSFDELRILKCAYYKECVFISRDEEGKCHNNNKVCKFQHEGETKDEYFKRIGM